MSAGGRPTSKDETRSQKKVQITGKSCFCLIVDLQVVKGLDGALYNVFSSMFSVKIENLTTACFSLTDSKTVVKCFR